MGGFDPKRWMRMLTGSTVGFHPTVSKAIIRRYGNRELECLTAFLNESSHHAEWYAISKKHIIIIKFVNFHLMAGKGETEYEARYGDNARKLAEWGGFEKPTTQEVIDFFNFKIREELILEFSY